jgi:hypothetical protein
MNSGANDKLTLIQVNPFQFASHDACRHSREGVIKF